MSDKMESYIIRLDNSIVDVVSLRSPQDIVERDHVTPKSQAWLDKCFPHRQGVLMSHINPNDTTGRRVYVYMNAEKPNDFLTQEEVDYTDFKLTPLILHEKVTKDDWRRHIFETAIENLKYVYPNIVKRSKIQNDGKTFAMVRDLNVLALPSNLKKKLEKYDFSKFDPSDIPDKDCMGLVSNVQLLGSLYPIEVTFPNGEKWNFITEDLHYFHPSEE